MLKILSKKEWVRSIILLFVSLSLVSYYSLAVAIVQGLTLGLVVILKSF